MQADAEHEVDEEYRDGELELGDEVAHQTRLKDVGVEEHEEHHDGCKDLADILDTDNDNDVFIFVCHPKQGY